MGVQCAPWPWLPWSGAWTQTKSSARPIFCSRYSSVSTSSSLSASSSSWCGYPPFSSGASERELPCGIFIFSHSEVRPRLLLHWILLCLSHLQQFGHCWCKKMEPMVCSALAVCLHSFQNLPHRLLHLRDSLQTIQFRPNLPALPDVVRDVGLETHAETLLYPWHGATNRNRC